MDDAIQVIKQQQMNIAYKSMCMNDIAQDERDIDIIADLTVAKILLRYLLIRI